MRNNYLLIIALLVIVGLIVYYVRSPDAAETPDTATETKTPTTQTPSQNNTPKTTTPTTVSVGAGDRVYEKGVYVTLIYLTSSGFVPASLEIKAGEEVRFVNKTSLTMRVVSDEKLSNQFYAYFNQAQSVGKGGTYQLSLMQPGVFSYFNLNSNPHVTGQVFVK